MSLCETCHGILEEDQCDCEAEKLKEQIAQLKKELAHKTGIIKSILDHTRKAAVR